jgi:oligosaccharide repeat unit polymerase
MNDLSFTLVYLILLTICLYLSKEQPTTDVLSPGVIFPLVLLGYSVASSLFVHQFGSTNFGYPVSPDIIRTFYNCALIGLGAFFWGRYLSVRFPVWHFKTSDTAEAADSRTRDKILVYALLSGLLCAPFIASAFNVLSQQSYAERALQLRIEDMEDSASGLKDALLVSTPIALIVCASSLLFFDRNRGIAIRCAGAIMIALNLGANLLAGWRGNLMMTLSLAGVYYHYRVRRFRLSHLLLGSTLIYVLINAMALMRISSDPSEMIDTLNGDIGMNSLSFLSLTRSGELLTGTNLMRQIGGVRDGELKYSFGKTVLDDILVFIPRPLYPERPLPSSEKFIDIFYPGVRETGGGYGFFILQEGHWVAGYFGVFVMMCGFGYLVYSVYWVFLSYKNSLGAVFAYALVFPTLCVFSVRSGVVSSLKSAVIMLIPVVLLWMLPPIRNYSRTPSVLHRT